MRIVNLEEKDIDAVISLTNRCENIEPERTSIYWVFWKFFRDSCFIAWEKDIMVGFLLGCMSQAGPRHGYVHTLGVHPDHRNEGIGSSLLNAFEAFVSERGATGICLTTRLENREAQKFYKETGFADIKKFSKAGHMRLELIRSIASSDERRTV